MAWPHQNRLERIPFLVEFSKVGPGRAAKQGLGAAKQGLGAAKQGLGAIKHCISMKLIKNGEGEIVFGPHRRERIAFSTEFGK